MRYIGLAFIEHGFDLLTSSLILSAKVQVCPCPAAKCAVALPTDERCPERDWAAHPVFHVRVGSLQPLAVRPDGIVLS